MMRRFVKIFLDIFGILLCGILIFSIALVWRLNSGPISLEFLKPQLINALTPDDQSYRLEIGEPVFRWQGWNTKIFDITLRDKPKLSDVSCVSFNVTSNILVFHPFHSNTGSPISNLYD